MTKPDDSTLSAADLLAVEARAKLSLDKAAAWGRFPTPVDDILAAAKLRVAPKGMFDAESFMAYVKEKASSAILPRSASASELGQGGGHRDAVAAGGPIART